MSGEYKRLEARFCGVGGQGIVLGTTVMADAAIFHEGKYAVQSPTFGSQVRGGPTKVDLIVDTQEILYPKATKLNFFFAMAQSSFNKYFHDLADDCTVLIDENLVVSIPGDKIEGHHYHLYRIPVMELAKQEFKNNMLANMICLGVTQEVTKVVSLDSLEQSVRKLVPPKHVDKNIAAVHMGIELAKKLQREEMSV